MQHHIREKTRLFRDSFFPDEIAKAHHELLRLRRILRQIQKLFRRVHKSRHPLKKEVVSRHLVPQIPHPPQLPLRRKNLLLHPPEILQHRMLPSHHPIHQSLPHKNLKSRLRIHPSKENPPPLHHAQPTQHDILQTINRPLLLVPVRRVELAPTKMRHHFLNPLRIDLRHLPRPQSARLHQLKSDHPQRPLLLKKSRSRKDRELPIRHPMIGSLLFIPNPDLTRHPGQNRLMHLRINITRLGILGQLSRLRLFKAPTKLRINPEPFPHSPIADKISLTPLPQLVRLQLPALTKLPNPTP